MLAGKRRVNGGPRAGAPQTSGTDPGERRRGRRTVGRTASAGPRAAAGVPPTRESVRLAARRLARDAIRHPGTATRCVASSAARTASASRSSSGSSGLRTLAMPCSITWVYVMVVDTSWCPSSNWTVRMSVPLSRRGVAKLWRNVWHVRGLVRPARRTASATARCQAPSWR